MSFNFIFLFYPTSQTKTQIVYNSIFKRLKLHPINFKFTTSLSFFVTIKSINLTHLFILSKSLSPSPSSSVHFSPHPSTFPFLPLTHLDVLYISRLFRICFWGHSFSSNGFIRQKLLIIVINNLQFFAPISTPGFRVDVSIIADILLDFFPHVFSSVVNVSTQKIRQNGGLDVN